MRLISTYLPSGVDDHFRAMSGSLALKVANAILLVLLSVLLARTLGPGAYGDYTFAVAVATLAMVPVQLGIPGLLVREVARGTEHADWSLVRGAIRFGWLSVGALSILISTILVLVLTQIDGIPEPRRIAMYAAVLLIPLAALNQVRQAVLQGFRRVVMGQVPELLLIPLVMIVTVWLFEARSITISSAHAIWFRVAGTTLALLIGLLMFRALTPGPAKKARPAYRPREWGRMLLPFSLLAGLGVVQGQADVFLLGTLVAPDQLGLYRVALTGAGLVVFAQSAFNTALAPRFAALHAAGDMSGLERLARFSAKAVLVTMLPMTLALIAAGRWIIAWLYGDLYVAAAVPLAILCVGQLVNGAVGSVALILNMTGSEKHTVRASVLMVIVSVLLLLLLVPSAGVNGAAVASTLSMILWNLLLLRQVRRRAGINPAVFSKAYLDG